MVDASSNGEAEDGRSVVVSRPANVSRTVQQLLERHGLMVNNHNINNNNSRTVLVGGPDGDDHQVDSDCEPRVRPDPIGAGLLLLATQPDVNGNGGSIAERLTEGDDDDETEELSKLRCQSVRTEVLAEKFRRKNPRCSDYPGLSFASSVFSSDTMMKFNIIKNELHNIMHNQLRRV